MAYLMVDLGILRGSNSPRHLPMTLALERPSSLSVLQDHLHQQVVGKERAIELVLTALIAGGHVLLEDVPGVGKTLLAKSLAQAIEGRYQRIQCTPDLLPSDLTGTNIWHPGRSEFEFMPGPVFTNILLADEINRATPRTQAALLEVMAESQVTIDGCTRPLAKPFFVIATQNPVEYQGTFPLPEAQMDRFMLCLSLGYPDGTEELRMLQGKTQLEQRHRPCLGAEELAKLGQQSRQVQIVPELQKYIVTLVQATRCHPDILLGASPRGTIALQQACQGRALLRNRDYVTPDDVKFLAPYVLTHRLVTQGGQRSSQVIDRLLQEIPVP